MPHNQVRNETEVEIFGRAGPRASRDLVRARAPDQTWVSFAVRRNVTSVRKAAPFTTINAGLLSPAAMPRPRHTNLT